LSRPGLVGSGSAGCGRWLVSESLIVRLSTSRWNVGYHNEHHDFCNVPWSRLPALKRCAPEFYDNLAVCDSWCGVIWDYIMRQEVGPYNRMKRPLPAGDFGAAEAVLRAKVE
jgi:hypothetical protein